MFGESMFGKFTKFAATKSRETVFCRSSGVGDNQDTKAPLKYDYFRAFRFVLIVSAVGMLLLAGLAVGGVAAQEEISDAAELQDVQDDLDGDYVLTGDIDMAGVSGFEPIGDRNDRTADRGGTPFTGTFDGNGYTISNLTIDRPNENYVGLFGAVGSGGTVENIGIENVTVTGDGWVGSLVGYNNGEIKRAQVTGEASSNWTTGGLVGTNKGEITTSYSVADVEGGRTEAGGLVGVNLNGDISLSYATGGVSGDEKVGGLVGVNFEGDIEETYATGSVPDGEDTGGLVGVSTGTVTDSYWDTETTGQDASDGGTGLTTSEMTGSAARENMGGFDFEDVWITIENPDGYPQLREPEILNVEQTPGAAETDESVEVEAEVKGAQTATLEYSVDGEKKEPIEMEITYPEEDIALASADIPETAHDIGSEITYRVTAENVIGKNTTGEFRYFSFDTVDDAAVVFAEYADDGYSDVDDVIDVQNNIQSVVNEYYASVNGSMGAVGFDFEFYDNDGDWFEVGNRDEYEDGFFSDGRMDFVDDSFNAAGVDQSEYDVRIGFSPETARQPGVERESKRVYMERRSDGENRNGIWYHELGHTQGAKDMYMNADANHGGSIGPLGQMGEFTARGLEMRFSSVGRTKYAELDRPLLELDTTTDYTTFFVDELSSKEYVPDDRNKVSEWDALGEDTSYVFEYRTKEKNLSDSWEDISGYTNRDTFREGVYIYRVDDISGIIRDKGTKISFVNRPDDTINNLYHKPSLENISDSTLHLDPNSFVKFDLADYTTFENSVAVIKAEEPTESASEMNVADLRATTLIDNPDSVSDSIITNVNPPTVRLEAYDSEGRKVGFNRETGEYMLEIPGSEASGIGRGDWIGIPQNATIIYRLNTQEVAKWIDETGVTTDRISIVYDFSLTEYGETPKIKEVNGATQFVDATIRRVTNQTIEPGETITVGATVDVDFDPDTLNKQSEGRWVTVSVESPHEEVDVADVNISTVRLNEEVDAVDDEQFGFVRNPVDGDTLKVKFPRDEVADVLETGEGVRVTVTGETDDGTVVVGNDEVRVIDRGGGPPGDDDDGSGGGPPEDTPGEGPSDNDTAGGPPEDKPSGGPPGDTPSGDGPDDGSEEDTDSTPAGPPEDTPGGDNSNDTPVGEPSDETPGDNETNGDNTDNAPEEEPSDDGGQNDRQRGEQDDNRGGGPPEDTPGAGPASFDSGGDETETQLYTPDDGEASETLRFDGGAYAEGDDATTLALAANGATERQVEPLNSDAPTELKFDVDTDINPTTVNLTRTDSAPPAVEKDNLWVRVTFADGDGVGSATRDIEGDEWNNDETIQTEFPSVESGQNVYVQLFYEPSERSTLLGSEIVPVGGFEVDIKDEDVTLSEGVLYEPEVTITNTAPEEDTQTVTLDVEGDVKDSTELTLGPEESKTINATTDEELSWSIGSVLDEDESQADFEVRVSSEDDFDTTEVTVTELEETADGFKLAPEDVPQQVGPDEAIVLEIRITNEADETLTQPVLAGIGQGDTGFVKNERATVTLGPGESTTRTFSAIVSEFDEEILSDDRIRWGVTTVRRDPGGEFVIVTDQISGVVEIVEEEPVERICRTPDNMGVSLFDFGGGTDSGTDFVVFQPLTAEEPPVTHEFNVFSIPRSPGVDGPVSVLVQTQAGGVVVEGDTTSSGQVSLNVTDSGVDASATGDWTVTSSAGVSSSDYPVDVDTVFMEAVWSNPSIFDSGFVDVNVADQEICAPVSE